MPKGKAGRNARDGEGTRRNTTTTKAMDALQASHTPHEAGCPCSACRGVTAAGRGRDKS